MHGAEQPLRGGASRSQQEAHAKATVGLQGTLNNRSPLGPCTRDSNHTMLLSSPFSLQLHTRNKLRLCGSEGCERDAVRILSTQAQRGCKGPAQRSSGRRGGERVAENVLATDIGTRTQCGKRILGDRLHNSACSRVLSSCVGTHVQECLAADSLQTDFVDRTPCRNSTSLRHGSKDPDANRLVDFTSCRNHLYTRLGPGRSTLHGDHVLRAPPNVHSCAAPPFARDL